MTYTLNVYKTMDGWEPVYEGTVTEFPDVRVYESSERDALEHLVDVISSLNEMSSGYEGEL